MTYNVDDFPTTTKKETDDFSFLATKKIVYLVNVDWFFISHRLPLARAARNAGAEVIVAAGDTGKGATLEKEGIRFVSLPFSRQGTSAGHELKTFFSVFRFLRKTKPDLLHTVSIKPVLYGALLSRILGSWPVVNAISGLGFVFSGDKKATILKKGISLFYKAALNNPRSITIFQNPSDKETMLNSGLIKEKNATLIRGSGVDCSLFSPAPLPEKPIIMLPSRMLWDKGVGEFVKAAEKVHPFFPDARFVLVGAADDENPKAIKEKEIQEWVRGKKYLEWWGAKEHSEMPEILTSASIVVLPSYHEGLPKVLLEAAACGKAIIASDIPGCREIVQDGKNGLLVPARDAQNLAKAILSLLNEPAKIAAFGEAGREIVCREFEESKIISQSFALYRILLSDKIHQQAQ